MTDRAPRQSLLLPVLIPVGALAVIGLVLFAFSRILLNTTHTGAVIVALVAAAGALGVAAWVAGRRSVGNAGLFSLVGGAAGIAMLAGGVALVAAPPHGDEEEPGVPVVSIVAAPNAAVDGFASDRYQVPAEIPFEIEFDNQDPGVPHNVEILTEEGGDVLFEGEVVNGPVVVTYAVEEPLAEGEYFFLCIVHPTTMTGTLEAVPGPPPGEGEPGEDNGDGAPAPDGLVVVAENLEFDTDTIELPADTPTTITFENRDDVGTFGPHNIAIYPDENLGTALFPGELINGPATVDYDVPALPAGEYFFHCDVHPQMQGDVLVDGGGGGPPDDG
jgi:plastocyanin